eukprot:m.30214 g.30214  ORF g.30214 m.30214 type:complete len:175 (-) comp16234_c0_seq1:231-755(-)
MEQAVTLQEIAQRMTGRWEMRSRTTSFYYWFHGLIEDEEEIKIIQGKLVHINTTKKSDGLKRVYFHGHQLYSINGANAMSMLGCIYKCGDAYSIEWDVEGAVCFGDLILSGGIPMHVRSGLFYNGNGGGCFNGNRMCQDDSDNWLPQQSFEGMLNNYRENQLFCEDVIIPKPQS